MLISNFLMIIISTSLTVPTQPSPRFHVEAWLAFRNREMDYLRVVKGKFNVPTICICMYIPWNAAGQTRYSLIDKKR